MHALSVVRSYSVRVPESPLDEGPSTTHLWVAAGLCAVVSLAGWTYLISHLDERPAWSAHTGLALCAGVTGSVLAAACAVIVAVTSSERRLRRSASVRLDSRTQ